MIILDNVRNRVGDKHIRDFLMENTRDFLNKLEEIDKNNGFFLSFMSFWLDDDDEYESG